MPRAENLPTNELIKRLRRRQGVLLNGLPPDLFFEYCAIENIINLALGRVDIEERELASPITNYEPTMPLEGAIGRDELAFFPPRTRTPLATHKANLIKFLGEHGAQSRPRLMRELAIPAASLTAILKGTEFVQKDGRWGLKTQTKKPGPSDSPAKK